MAVSGPSPMRTNLQNGWDGAATSVPAGVIKTDAIGAGSAEPISTGVVATVGLLSAVAIVGPRAPKRAPVRKGWVLESMIHRCATQAALHRYT